MTRMIKIGLVLCLVLFASCRNKQKPPPLPPNVITATVEQRDVPIYIDSIGQVIPPVTVQIRPQVAGKLLAVYVQQGAIVKANDILYTVDPRPYQALLDEAIAQLAHDIALLEYAEIAVKRYKKVVEDDYISIFTYEQYLSNEAAAKAQVELDQAAIRAAEINVNYCQITAPVDGKISFFAVDVGNIVAVDDPTALTAIRPFNPIDISFSLPQQHFELIRREQGDAGAWKFVATLPERPKTPFKGTTYFLDNQIDQDTGTILLKGRIPNNERELWPGEFIKVKVLQKIAPQAFVVPPGAVLIGKNGPYVYLVDNEGKAVNKNVTVLMRSEDSIAVDSSELKAGDTVIVDGQINIAPGVIVNATPQKSDQK